MRKVRIEITTTKRNKQSVCSTNVTNDAVTLQESWNIPFQYQNVTPLCPDQKFCKGMNCAFIT